MIFFTHVPKTGGSTINEAARRLLKGDAAFVKRPGDLEGLPDTLRYIGGHVRFTESVERFPEANFIGSLREPLHRVLSHYMMFLRDDPESAGTSFREFYARHITKKKRDNLQCRFLCGEPSASKAFESIQRNYALVWTVSRTDDIWPIVCEMLTGKKISEPAPRMMVADNAPRDYDTYLPSEDAAFVRGDNKQDTILHEWIAAAYNGLFVSYSIGRAYTSPLRNQTR